MCATTEAFSDSTKTKAELSPANDQRRRTEEMLREIAFVLAMTRRVKSEIVKDESPSA